MKDSQENASQTAQYRRNLIATIEAERNSKVITYFVSDRPNAAAQMAEDAVRPMYDHLRAIGQTQKVDLFIYSTGGLTDAPWRIITMIREFVDELSVLVPYKAMSAATMVALGADEIVMGRKGELGPIDPQLSITRGGGGETVVQEQVAVEDIMSYLRFVKEHAGVEDQQALAHIITSLADKVDPRTLGQLNRAHSHIRDVARKLLNSHADSQEFEEEQIKLIINTLAQETYQHGHAIGRREAANIGLKINIPSNSIENTMWLLFEAYEELCKLRVPLDLRSLVPHNQLEQVERLTMACIESLALSDHFTSDLRVRNKRQVPPQLNLNLNLTMSLPPALQAQQLPEAIQQAAQQIIQQLQQNMQSLLQQALLTQMPVSGVEGGMENSAWRRQSVWPMTP